MLPVSNNLITPIKSYKINFSGKEYVHNALSSSSKKVDNCHFENIAKLVCHAEGELKQIIYSTPQTISTAFIRLLQTKNKFIKDELKASFHSGLEIQRIIKDLKKSPQIGESYVKSLYGFGATAFAFELDNGNILKITQYNHFPEDREPADFDVPIYEKGKIGENTYYYIEEKLFQTNITQEEIKELCNYIESQGYELRDVKHFFKKDYYLERQFGKDTEGNLYLCDPGCARLKEDRLPILKSIKRAIIEIVGMMIDEIT